MQVIYPPAKKKYRKMDLVFLKMMILFRGA
jgi:hypothetical protein